MCVLGGPCCLAACVVAPAWFSWHDFRQQQQTKKMNVIYLFFCAFHTLLTQTRTGKTKLGERVGGVICLSQGWVGPTARFSQTRGERQRWGAWGRSERLVHDTSAGCDAALSCVRADAVLGAQQSPNIFHQPLETTSHRARTQNQKKLKKIERASSPQVSERERTQKKGNSIENASLHTAKPLVEKPQRLLATCCCLSCTST